MAALQPADQYWDRNPTAYVAGQMIGWCDAAFALYRSEHGAPGFFLGKWAKDLGTKGGTLYCNQDCLDTVRHFVVTRYVERCYKVEVRIDTYIALATRLLNYVRWATSAARPERTFPPRSVASPPQQTAQVFTARSVASPPQQTAQVFTARSVAS